jgi:hypothetical protein
MSETLSNFALKIQNIKDDQDYIHILEILLQFYE